MPISVRIWFGFLLALLSFNVLAAGGFPGRRLYPDVATYSLDQLYRNFNKVVVVDARSTYEYNTLHIKGVIDMPVDDNSFGKRIRQLRASTDKPIVFYCNGRTCHKSYQAARKAHDNKVTNVFAYDAGVLEWAQAHPDMAVLLGHSPVKPDELIDAKKYQAHLLDPTVFEQRTQQPDVIVLDVRDPLQRQGIRIFGGEHSVSLDETNKLAGYVDQAKREHKTLLVYDEVGKQVVWLQYHLEGAKLKDYYFMKGGVEAYYKVMTQRMYHTK